MLRLWEIVFYNILLICSCKLMKFKYSSDKSEFIIQCWIKTIKRNSPSHWNRINVQTKTLRRKSERNFDITKSIFGAAIHPDEWSGICRASPFHMLGQTKVPFRCCIINSEAFFILHRGAQLSIRPRRAKHWAEPVQATCRPHHTHCTYS